MNKTLVLANNIPTQITTPTTKTSRNCYYDCHSDR